MTIPAALYLRVSTGQQVDRGSSLPSQEDACREYAERNGYSVANIFTDEGESARTADRPAFQEMIYQAKQPNPPFQAIICYENSRFARSREDAILYKTLLRKKGIDLIFTKQDFDDTPAGRLLEGIIEVVDEWYSLNLAVETRRGQKQTAAQGFSCGGRPPYGLRRVEVKNEHGRGKVRWEPDPQTSPVVRQIYEDFAGGKGQKAIAYDLNARGIPAPRGQYWTANSLHYLLFKNAPAYLGQLVFNREDNSRPGHKFKPEEEWVIVKDAWEPIIDEETAEKVRSKRREGKKPRRKEGGTPYILSGLLYCGLCGASMKGSSMGRKETWRYYRCHRNGMSGKAACPQKMIRQDLAEGIVLDDMKERFLSERTLLSLMRLANARTASGAKESQKRIRSMGKEKEALLRRKNNLLGAIEEGIVDRKDVRERVSELNDGIARMEREIEAARNEAEQKPFTREECLTWKESLAGILEMASPERMEAFLKSVVERIDVTEDTLKIEYKFNPG